MKIQKERGIIFFLLFYYLWFLNGKEKKKRKKNLKHFYIFDGTPVGCFTAFHFCATASKPKFFKECHWGHDVDFLSTALSEGFCNV